MHCCSAHCSALVGSLHIVFFGRCESWCKQEREKRQGLAILTSIIIYLINVENLNLGISIVLFATTRVNGLKLFTFPVKSFGRYRKVQLKYCNYFPSRNKQRFLRNVISLELSSLWGVEKQTNKSSGNVASVVLLLWYLVVTGTVRRYRLSRMVFWRSWSTPPFGNLVLRYCRRSLVIEPEIKQILYFTVFHSSNILCSINIFCIQQIFFTINKYFLQSTNIFAIKQIHYIYI